MASYGNFSFPNKTGQACNDLHLKFPVGTANVNVLGVDGVGPDAPSAGYNLQGDGSGVIDISGYNVPVNGSVTVRIKTPGMTLPTPIVAQWTQNAAAVKAAFEVALGGAAPIPAGTSEPVSEPKPERAHETLARIAQLAEEALFVSAKT